MQSVFRWRRAARLRSPLALSALIVSLSCEAEAPAPTQRSTRSEALQGMDAGACTRTDDIDSMCNAVDEDCDGQIDEDCDFGPSQCPAGYNIIQGTAGDDILIGGNGSNCILGYGGDDQLFGGNQSDILRGGPGNDILDCGNGKDEVYGGSGDDVLNCGNGTDGTMYGMSSPAPG